MPGPVNTEPAPVAESARQHFVRMRDGIRLATDTYVPAGDGAFPAILVRLPYDKNSRYVFMDVVARRANAAGYVLVVQDVRGKYRSEGDALGPVNEAQDGYDTLSWITAQEWSDGRVGMFGDSYYGFTQYAAASTGHPALRALVPRVTTSRMSINDLVEGDGVIDIPWGTGAVYLLQCWTGPYVNERQPDWTRRPLLAAFDEQFSEIGARSLWFDQTIPHHVPTKVYPYGHPVTRRPIPIMHCIGWWDNLAIHHMRDYLAFAADAGWAATQYLWVDSIDHENYHIDEAGRVADRGDHDSDDTALELMMDNYIEPALRFFDVFVKGVAPAAGFPRVQWHLSHAGYRRDESWPPPSATPMSLFLTGLQAMTAQGGVLESAPPRGEEHGSWIFDPDQPLTSPAQSSWSYLLEYPDERASAERQDVAVFDSGPLEKDLDLAGPVDLWVRVGSDAVTADVFARLVDVAPDGTAHLVVRGQAEITAPDHQSLRRIELGHAGYRFRAGHRLRLHIASSDFPEYLLNPGTGENRWTATEFRLARHTLTTDAAQPARLDLTVLP